MEQREEATLALCDTPGNDSGGEGAASGAGAPAVWVKYADGDMDEVEREVRATRGAPRSRGATRAHAISLVCTRDAFTVAPRSDGPQVALLSPIMRDLVVLDGVGTHDAPLLLPKQARTDALRTTRSRVHH
jgi:hypothetical protein